MRVAEGDVLVHEIEMVCTSGQPFGTLPNFDQANSREAVGLAIAAAEQIDEGLDGKRLQRVLGRVRRDLVRRAAIVDEEIGRHGDAPGRRADHVADIAEAVDIVLGRNKGIELHPVRA